MRFNFALLGLALYAGSAYAQPPAPGSFSSTSTGADGPLTYAANLGTVYFPSTALGPRANNIYNFTTVSIGAGTTVRISGWVINGPVYWLAQGDVTISGILDLSGQNGVPPNSPTTRAPSEPGSGGYSGGVPHLGTGQNATAGNGPGGGVTPGWNTSIPDAGGPGVYTGSIYLQPLIGGSGGGGGCSSSTNNNCGGGGAGGGAILIASSTQIVIGGYVKAYGGNGSNNYGGAGSGGAIRLVSNSITANSGIVVCGGLPGSGGSGLGGGGIARVEAFSYIANIGVAACNSSADQVGTLYTSVPYNLALPTGGASLVSVTSVNGTTINANPFTFPDATINTGSSVPVIISGANVPAGTQGNLYIFSESAPDQMLPFTLAGTLQSTTATVNVPYPAGGSRGFAKATWKSQ